ncbi:recombination regulator RecX [Paraclostridium ghonii]|uniref:recombination regulator RecX n=1 Tax=Paraclostridium ghonii TaxID=29358 RepID=UPI00202D0362|nr:recombination regulator RecX [Paeniclostridium ghonii]MCM0165248.1 recombination regulator RecX [Paeniclostridium ghonii]
MSIITKIEVQQKNEDRVNIYLNEQFFMGIYKELVFTLNLKKGMEIDEDILKGMLHDEMYIKAKNKALTILSKAPQSEKNIIKKLSNDFDEDIIEEVLVFLRKYNFVNDEDLAQRITNTNLKVSKCGKNRIKQNLYNKGIDRNTIDSIVSDIDSDVEFENAMYLAKKRYERVKNEDRNKIYQKISQHLAYKGFDYGVIKRVLNKLLNFDESDYC